MKDLEEMKRLILYATEKYFRLNFENKAIIFKEEEAVNPLPYLFKLPELPFKLNLLSDFYKNNLFYNYFEQNEDSIVFRNTIAE